MVLVLLIKNRVNSKGKNNKIGIAQEHVNGGSGGGGDGAFGGGGGNDTADIGKSSTGGGESGDSRVDGYDPSRNQNGTKMIRML